MKIARLPVDATIYSTMFSVFVAAGILFGCGKAPVKSVDENEKDSHSGVLSETTK